MLVLSLKLDDSVFIGPDIEVKVTKFQGGEKGLTVKLGIQAPRHVAIIRGELLEENHGRPGRGPERS